MLPKYSTKIFLGSCQEQRAELVLVPESHLYDQDDYMSPTLNLEGLRCMVHELSKYVSSKENCLYAMKTGKHFRQ